MLSQVNHGWSWLINKEQAATVRSCYAQMKRRTLNCTQGAHKWLQWEQSVTANLIKGGRPDGNGALNCTQEGFWDTENFLPLCQRCENMQMPHQFIYFLSSCTRTWRGWCCRIERIHMVAIFLRRHTQGETLECWDNVLLFSLAATEEMMLVRIWWKLGHISRLKIIFDNPLANS